MSVVDLATELSSLGRKEFLSKNNDIVIIREKECVCVRVRVRGYEKKSKECVREGGRDPKLETTSIYNTEQVLGKKSKAI